MKYLSNVSTLNIIPVKCVGCGLCSEVCPHGVFDLIDGKASITDRDKCMECGACANNCAFGALTVDKGVGCASAIIYSLLTGNPPKCGCDDNPSGTSSGCC
jgi:NAD-dependent dihydropyrimidine dehydrogenase PreA subunit